MPIYFWCAVRVILQVALFSLLSSLFCLFYCFLVGFICPCLFCSPVLLLFILCRGSFYSLLFVLQHGLRFHFSIFTSCPVFIGVYSLSDLSFRFFCFQLLCTVWLLFCFGPFYSFLGVIGCFQSSGPVQLYRSVPYLIVQLCLFLALFRVVSDLVYFRFYTGPVQLYHSVPYLIVVSFLLCFSIVLFCFRLLWYLYSCVLVVVPFCTVSIVVASLAVCRGVVVVYVWDLEWVVCLVRMVPY